MESADERAVKERMKNYEAATAGIPNADKALLAIAAMEETMKEQRVAAKKRHWAYMTAFSLPPLGFIIAGWYYFSDKADAPRVSKITFGISIVGSLLIWLSIIWMQRALPVGLEAQLMKSLTTGNVENLQDIDINSLSNIPGIENLPAYKNLMKMQDIKNNPDYAGLEDLLQ